MKPKPKYMQIIEEIKRRIKAGDYPIGSRLPSERKLASQFKVNRSTIIRSYEELTALGILERRVGSGTYVSEHYNLLFEGQTNWYQTLTNQPISTQAEYQEKVVEYKKKAMDLYTGELSSRLIPNFNFPAFNWTEIADMSQDTAGLPELKQAVCQHLRMQNIQIKPDEVLITSGARQALFLILQVLLSPGDTVAIETPSFLYRLSLFQSAKIKTIQIPIDIQQKKINIQALEKAFQQNKIKFLILNPNFHNPTGITLTSENRQELIQICASYQIPIIEDDVFQLFNFTNKKIKPLKSMDSLNVIYLGSLSKVLGKNINIGWCIAPPFMVKKLAAARELMDFNLNIFPQIIAAQAFNAFDFQNKINQTNQVLKHKHIELLEVIAKYPSWLPARIDGGLYQWLTYKRDLSRTEFDYFIEEKLLIAPSFIFGQQYNAIRINFSKLNDIVEFENHFKNVNQRLEQF
ncbi:MULTISPECIES: PLP-dependent aminotransferase family protein [unclassified Enterococcus]|uniref:aminotransferase-like domain-containing protein n=1 Tax=unclassified Enterococcus TaxID=2608891 RepID=UPI001555EB78|nr:MULTISPECIES: PLP-dependent aminotransferase family protein [unclassified Enterococcus]MBS7576921.1 PLP-dependent aminotransferase family protein [Enterococcus sp. MMGLQ5-2]MBS7584328.1 PLP-dependent aminotransferase family protein [Enterococcus sp. MMGLQ5-1]NPD12184.1 PLP-dependent aminotransferase family protein [Enterococcus sp. MMGLQ5-1]NPD36756.1 PLP-dependent aminotransferase family protein [Enterococcus sp. MMGLQ5-2]